MNLEWLYPNTIYLTLAGSQAYGLANELSDVDVKGICMVPPSVENDLFHKFEQAENPEFLEKECSHIINPKNPKLEGTVYSLKKFFTLASAVNPNIIELLWTDPYDHLIFNAPFDKIMDNRLLFLSAKAKFTFSGYAYAQAAKIERHRKWIVQGELKEPKREDFGLPDIKSSGIDEVFSYIKAKVEEWNLNQFPLDEMQRADLKELMWELINQLSGKDISWDNWPSVYSDGVMNKMSNELNLREEVVSLINAERKYHKAKNNYKSWLTWKEERNPARRELEVKCGYDSKHASHLIRLMKMGLEILTEGKVIVKRPDAEELLSIKNGEWSYERVMEYAKSMQDKMDEVYSQLKTDREDGKETIIPWGVDFQKINSFYHELYSGYWK